MTQVVVRNATPAVRSFGLPPDRTVALGQQVILLIERSRLDG